MDLSDAQKMEQMPALGNLGDAWAKMGFKEQRHDSGFKSRERGVSIDGQLSRYKRCLSNITSEERAKHQDVQEKDFFFPTPQHLNATIMGNESANAGMDLLCSGRVSRGLHKMHSFQKSPMGSIERAQITSTTKLPLQAPDLTFSDKRPKKERLTLPLRKPDV